MMEVHEEPPDEASDGHSVCAGLREDSCQIRAVAELSVVGSRGSRGFWCGSGDYASTPKMGKAGRGWLQRLGGSTAPTQFFGMPQISRGQAGLVGGHTQVDFRTKLQG